MNTTTIGIRSFSCILKFKAGYFKNPNTSLEQNVKYMMGKTGQFFTDKEVIDRIKRTYQTTGDYCEVIAITETTEGTESKKIL